MKTKLTISITLLLMSVFIVKAQWTELTSGTTMNLYSVFFTDASTGYVVGGKFDLVWQGSVGKTTDGGDTWVHAIEAANELNSVHFPDANTGYIVGNGGVILKTVNAGADWLPQTSGVTINLESVHFVDANIGYAVGSSGVILKTTDGGANWIAQTSGVTIILESVHFVDANIGYVVGSDVILKTTDGGSNWVAQTSGFSFAILFSVHFVDVNTGYVCGFQGGSNISLLLKTTDGGANWTQHVNGIATGSVDPMLRSVYFINASEGFVVGGSFIAKTTDGAANWTQQVSPVSQAFNAIHFPVSTVGYIVGNEGKILREGDPCNPNPTIIPNNLVLCPNTTDTLWTQSFDTYKWFRDGGEIIGETNQYLVVNSNWGGSSFVVEVTEGACTETSSGVIVDSWVFLLPVVQATGDFDVISEVFEVCLNDSIHFTLWMPYDTNISWTKNGVAIPGANSNVLSLTSDVVTSTDIYSVFGAPSICPDYIQQLGVPLAVLFKDCSVGMLEQISDFEYMYLFPNPVSDVLNIHTQNNNSLVEIYNPMGQLIHTSAFNDNTQISTNGFAAGVYIVKVSSGTDVRYEKIIVK